jgi:hypothetical protein
MSLLNASEGRWQGLDALRVAQQTFRHCQVACHDVCGYRRNMILSLPSSALKGLRFPRSVIGYVVWSYHRFALRLRDLEDLLAERGITVHHETIRDWLAKFGA